MWQKINKSYLIISIISLLCVINVLCEKPWIDRGVITWDSACYYAYLPAAFNPPRDTLTVDEINNIGLNPNQKYLPGPLGKPVFKTTMGMAVLYSPFYAVGYLNHYANHGYPGTGVEIEYRRAMAFYGVGMLTVFLLLLCFPLKPVTNDLVLGATLSITVFGTNLWYYTTYEGCMTHLTNATLLLLFVLLVKRWYTKPNFANALYLGLLSGLLTLIRPTNAIAAILFLLYDITSWQQVKARLSLLLSKWHLIAVLCISAVIVWLPQMFYWYNVTGQWFYYSYGIEKFYFNNPQFYNSLIGWRKGWFVYTPIAVVMLSGLLVMHKYLKAVKWAVVIYLVVFIYITVSWWCWWWGGSFGNRAMIDTYGLLSISLACLLNYVYELKNRKIIKYCLVVMLALFMGLNVFQTYQYKRGFIHYDSMTFKAYKSNFLKLQRPSEEFLKPPPWGEAVMGEDSE